MVDKDPFADWEKQDAKFCKIALEYHFKSGIVSKEEYENLNKMISSPDSENLEVAKQIIKNKDD